MVHQEIQVCLFVFFFEHWKNNYVSLLVYSRYEDSTVASTYFLCYCLEFAVGSQTVLRIRRQRTCLIENKINLFSPNWPIRVIRVIFLKINPYYYSLIAFDKRVTFWLQRLWSLPCACVYVALFARRLTYITIIQSHMHTMQQTHTHKAVTGRVEAKKLLSCRRQSEYNMCIYQIWMVYIDFFFGGGVFLGSWRLRWDISCS